MKQEVKVSLVPITNEQREQFIKEIQAAFKVAVVEEFGDNGEEVIPRKDVEEAMDAKNAETYFIIKEGQIVGGTVLDINPETHHNGLSLLYINPNAHSKGLGLAAWKAIEALHPETVVWETHTPYFEKRNIHFYVNKCGFHIVEFFGPQHPDPHMPSEDVPGADYFLRFEKQIK